MCVWDYQKKVLSSLGISQWTEPTLTSIFITVVELQPEWIFLACTTKMDVFFSEMKAENFYPHFIQFKQNSTELKN